MNGKGRKGRGEERRERQKEKEDLLWVSLIKSQSRKRFSLINLFIRSYLAKAFISCSSPGCAFTIAGAFSGIRIFQKALVSLQRVRLLISSASTSRDLCALLLYIYIFFFLWFVKLFAFSISSSSSCFVRIFVPSSSSSLFVYFCFYMSDEAICRSSLFTMY